MKEHVSVMVGEYLEALRPHDEQRLIVDATLGLAGHAVRALEVCVNARLIGFDQDPEAREIAALNLARFEGRFEIEADNFRHIDKLARREGWSGADMVFFDLGVSNLQLTDAGRGFSFQEDGPLDMRMDCGDGCNSVLSAKDILDEWSAEDMSRIFREYGEERFAWQIAKGIVRNRERGHGLYTTGELVDLIRKILPEPVQRKMGGHPARRVFQALRIAVNDETEALNEALDGAIRVVKPMGRIVVISYHSLEDRMVKLRFRKWNEEGRGVQAPRKAVTPTEDEVESNRKSRSARMRIFRAESLERRTDGALPGVPT